MTPSWTHTTRLMAAAALRDTGHVRTWLLKWLQDPHRAIAPELGVDLALVAEVASWAEARERRFTWVFFVFALTAFGFVATDMMPLAVVSVLAAAVTWFVKDRWERSAVRHQFGRQSFEPAEVARSCSAPLPHEGAQALSMTNGNLTVYSGFSPFVGAGLDFGGWSFTIAVDKASKEFGAPRPARFTLGDLYQSIGDAIARLDLPHVDQRDHFFVQGSDIRQDLDILAGIHARPSSRLSDGLAAQYSTTCDPRVRHYRWIRIMDWSGDIIVSYFLRCALRGPMLYVEAKRYLLTPPKDVIRQLDNESEPDLRDTMLHLFLLAPLFGLGRMIAAPFSLLSYAGELWETVTRREARERERLIDHTPLWDYGAATTARQHFASAEYVRYFQKTDTDFFEKALEKEVLGALIDFLDSCGVDTSDLRERQSTILNHGVIVQGGNIEAGSLAVGQGARSVQQTVRNVANRAKNTHASRQGAA